MMNSWVKVCTSCTRAKQVRLPVREPVRTFNDTHKMWPKIRRILRHSKSLLNNKTPDFYHCFPFFMTLGIYGNQPIHNEMMLDSTWFVIIDSTGTENKRQLLFTHLVVNTSPKNIIPPQTPSVKFYS